MRVAIRVDASLQIGTGHVMRCLTLAEELTDGGAEVVFICRKLKGNLAAVIKNKGYKVFLLTTDKNKQSQTISQKYISHKNWLETSWQEDAKQTSHILCQKFSYDWLVVDHYALDSQWEGLLKKCVNKIAVIDDLADRPHDCDLLLDQNLYQSMGSRYAGLLPGSCKQLLGPSYALLRNEFKQARLELKAKGDVAHRVLVFFGGVDIYNMTAMAIEALLRIKSHHLAVDVVVGVSNPHKVEIERYCKSMNGFYYYEQVDHMAELMLSADFAVGAGGSTNWERMCLGLPSILVSIAKNQQEVLENMHRLNLCNYLGTYKDVTTEYLQIAIQGMLENPLLIKKMRDLALNLMRKKEESLSQYILGWQDGE